MTDISLLDNADYTTAPSTPNTGMMGSDPAEIRITPVSLITYQIIFLNQFKPEIGHICRPVVLELMQY